MSSMRDLFGVGNIPAELRGLAALYLACGRGVTDDLRALGYQINEALPQQLARISPELKYDANNGYFETSEPLPSSLDEAFVNALLALEQRFEALDLSDRDRAFERLSSLAAMLLEQGENERSLALLRLTGQLLSWAPSSSARMQQESSFRAASGSVGTLAWSRSNQALVPPLRVRLLGDLEVECGSQLLRHSNLYKGLLRTAFMLLVLNQGKGITRDTLLGWLWPGRETERALVSFYNLWHRLTCDLQMADGSCPYLVNEAQLLRVDSRYVTSDIAEFERLARTVLFEHGDYEERIAAVDRLEQLYRHDILVVAPMHPQIIAAQERYRGMFTDVLISASRLHLERDNSTMALWYARRAYETEPQREDVCRVLMATQEASGQRSSALSTYFDYKRYLADELGLYPSQQTTALYQELILGGS
jgi:DNA-binding SARP family transcriptional activator